VSIYSETCQLIHLTSDGAEQTQCQQRCQQARLARLHSGVTPAGSHLYEYLYQGNWVFIACTNMSKLYPREALSMFRQILRIPRGKLAPAMRALRDNYVEDDSDV